MELTFIVGTTLLFIMTVTLDFVKGSWNIQLKSQIFFFPEATLGYHDDDVSVRKPVVMIADLIAEGFHDGF